jgi:hypothetical protein
MNISYTLDQVDKDIGTWDRCILIHIDDNLILRFSNYDELVKGVEQLNYIKDDIFINHPEISH